MRSTSGFLSKMAAAAVVIILVCLVPLPIWSAEAPSATNLPEGAMVETDPASQIEHITLPDGVRISRSLDPNSAWVSTEFRTDRTRIHRWRDGTTVETNPVSQVEHTTRPDGVRISRSLDPNSSWVSTEFRTDRTRIHRWRDGTVEEMRPDGSRRVTKPGDSKSGEKSTKPEDAEKTTDKQKAEKVKKELDLSGTWLSGEEEWQVKHNPRDGTITILDPIKHLPGRYVEYVGTVKGSTITATYHVTDPAVFNPDFPEKIRREHLKDQVKWTLKLELTKEGKLKGIKGIGKVSYNKKTLKITRVTPVTNQVALVRKGDQPILAKPTKPDVETKKPTVKGPPEPTDEEIEALRREAEEAQERHEQLRREYNGAQIRFRQLLERAADLERFVKGRWNWARERMVRAETLESRARDAEAGAPRSAEEVEELRQLSASSRKQQAAEAREAGRLADEADRQANRGASPEHVNHLREMAVSYAQRSYEAEARAQQAETRSTTPRSDEEAAETASRLRQEAARLRAEADNEVISLVRTRERAGEARREATNFSHFVDNLLLDAARAREKAADARRRLEEAKRRAPSQRKASP